jgi:hypothetical protein
MYTARWCAGIKVQKEAQNAEGYHIAGNVQSQRRQDKVSCKVSSMSRANAGRAVIYLQHSLLWSNGITRVQEASGRQPEPGKQPVKGMNSVSG